MRAELARGKTLERIADENGVEIAYLEELVAEPPEGSFEDCGEQRKIDEISVENRRQKRRS